MMQTCGLYFHVPFCLHKCGYCDFYSLPYRQEDVLRYIACIKKMLGCVPQGKQTFSTVYFGGGTPSLLSPGEIADLLETVARFHALHAAEVTLECNPGSVKADYFPALKKAGVNRLSMGLQSSDAQQLKRMGRIHTPQQAAQCVRLAQDAGFENISLDVMIGLPGQTESELMETLSFCAALEVQHISAYLLKIEPGTEFEREGIARLCPGDEEQAQLYLAATAALEKMGYAQYEISNFAKPGFESQHNTLYWKLESYLGLGPAAHSFIGGHRYYFPRDLSAFLCADPPWALWQSDGLGGDVEEFMMLSLRLRTGLDLEQLENAYHFSAESLLRRAAPFLTAGLMQREKNRVFLTPQGFLLSNSIIIRLLDDGK